MEITPAIHQVGGMHGNCYIVVRDGLVLVDTGMPGNRKKILSYVKEDLKRDPSEIHTILLTHFHIDHTGNVAELKKDTGAKVAIHGGDAPYLSGDRPMPVPKKRPMLFRILRFFMKFTPVRPDIILSDGDAIAGLTCIHTPGHTPGSSCFLDPAEKVLFAGDTILTPGGSVHGPSGEFSADPVQARQSVERIAPLDFDILLSGHGEPVRPGAAARVREFLAEEKA